MNRVVRDNGSSELSESDSSCDLPSRSVNIVNMKKSSQLSIGSLKASRMRGLSRLPLWRDEELLGLVAPVPAEVGVQQVDHRPQMAPLFDVHLKQVPQVVQARAPLAEPPLLLDAGWLGVALRHDQPAKLIAELARHFLPDRLAEEVAESDATVVHGIRKEDPPSVLRQLHVLEVGPPGRIDAHRRADVDLVVVLKPLRAHVLPPLNVLRLPVLERALQTLVAREADVVGDLFG